MFRGDAVTRTQIVLNFHGLHLLASKPARCAELGRLLNSSFFVYQTSQARVLVLRGCQFPNVFQDQQVRFYVKLIRINRFISHDDLQPECLLVLLDRQVFALYRTGRLFSHRWQRIQSVNLIISILLVN